MKLRLLRLAARLGLVSARHPMSYVSRAWYHIAHEYYSQASFRERGIPMPWQREALAILEQRETELVKTKELVILD